MDEYVIVEFLDSDSEDTTVDIVHKTWLKSTQNALFSYWPKLGCTKKAKTGAIPDKKQWSLYKIRILSTTDNYEKAVRRCKNAEQTSNVETEEDTQHTSHLKRKKFQPIRYEDSDTEEEESRPKSAKPINGKSLQTNINPVPSLPVPPQVNNASPSLSFPPQLNNASPSLSFPPQLNNASPSLSFPPQLNNASPEASPSLPCRSPRNPAGLPSGNNDLPSLSRPSLSTSVSPSCQPGPSSMPARMSNTIRYDGRSFSPDTSDGEDSRLSARSRPASSLGLGSVEFSTSTPRNQRHENNIMRKLNEMTENQKDILSLLRQLNVTRNGAAVNETELDQSVIDFNPMDTVNDLEVFNTRLIEDQTFKRKMVKQLSSLGGHSNGDTMRRILKTLGTNALWCKYSLKGKKGKQALQTLPVCAVIIKAFTKNHPSARTADVEELIGETLKHAPAKPAGTRYKEPAARRISAAGQE